MAVVGRRMISEHATALDGQPQQVGKKTRTIPPSTRRGVNLRDQGCRFPGCGARKYIDVHHIKHWAHGGTHEMANFKQSSLTGPKSQRTKISQSVLIIKKIDSRSIERANKANGLSIDPNTCITKWCGDRLDLDLIMSGLWQVDHPPEEWRQRWG
ncbi:MAG: HNH endonuclease signature motif containing protein [Acidimicrobiales bacterium]